MRLKKIFNKKKLFSLVIFLLVILCGYYIGLNFDAISFAVIHPDKVREAKQAWTIEIQKADIRYSEKLGVMVSPLTD